MRFMFFFLSANRRGHRATLLLSSLASILPASTRDLVASALSLAAKAFMSGLPFEMSVQVMTI
jgi:hypothetical protein